MLDVGRWKFGSGRAWWWGWGGVRGSEGVGGISDCERSSRLAWARSCVVCCGVSIVEKKESLSNSEARFEGVEVRAGTCSSTPTGRVAVIISLVA